MFHPDVALRWSSAGLLSWAEEPVKLSSTLDRLTWWSSPPRPPSRCLLDSGLRRCRQEAESIFLWCPPPAQVFHISPATVRRRRNRSRGHHHRQHHQSRGLDRRHLLQRATGADWCCGLVFICVEGHQARPLKVNTALEASTSDPLPAPPPHHHHLQPHDFYCERAQPRTHQSFY